jgi:hypothetical protein
MSCSWFYWCNRQGTQKQRGDGYVDMETLGEALGGAMGGYTRQKKN